MFNVIVRNSKGEPVSTTFVEHTHCSLGLLADNAVVLPGWKVARVHAELNRKEDGVHISNRAKMKSLRVNDNKVENYGPLTLGDTINIGDYQIKIQIKRSGDRQPPEESLRLLEQHRRVHEKLYRYLANGMAKLPAEMAMSDVSEIMVNAHNEIFYETDDGTL